VHPDGWPEAVDAGTWLAAFGLVLQSFPDLLIHARNLATNDRVAILETWLSGTNTGPLHLGDADRLVLGAEQLPATGRAMKITGVVVLEIVDDLVTSERHYWPVVDSLVQLGLVSTRHTVPTVPVSSPRWSRACWTSGRPVDVLPGGRQDGSRSGRRVRRAGSGVVRLSGYRVRASCGWCASEAAITSAGRVA
jgi:hypothetical protein